MMWLGVYQSARCWLLSALCTAPIHSLTVAAGADRRPPHPSRIAAVSSTRPSAISQYGGDVDAGSCRQHLLELEHGPPVARGDRRADQPVDQGRRQFRAAGPAREMDVQSVAGQPDLLAILGARLQRLGAIRRRAWPSTGRASAGWARPPPRAERDCRRYRRAIAGPGGRSPGSTGRSGLRSPFPAPPPAPRPRPSPRRRHCRSGCRSAPPPSRASRTAGAARPSAPGCGR